MKRSRVSLAILMATLLVLSTVSFVFASTPETSNVNTKLVELKAEYRKVFKEEYEFIDEYFKGKDLSKISPEEIYNTIKNEEPLVDTGKWIGDNYYHLTVYKNGTTVTPGIKGGSAVDHGTFLKWTGREAYLSFYTVSPSIDGHYFSSEVNYTLYAGSNKGRIDSTKARPTYCIQVKYPQVTINNNITPATATWRYQGRTGVYYDTGTGEFIDVFNNMLFFIKVGSSATVSWGLG